MFLSRFLGSKTWRTVEKMSITFLLLGPTVIGFTTYSLQNGIYFDFETVFVYFVGDWVITVILTVLVMSAIDYQLYLISKYAKKRLFEKEVKYSILMIED